MIRSSKKTLKKRRMIKALDDACRQEVVTERDNDTCQRCGMMTGQRQRDQMTVIQWAHVHTREYYVTRWEPDNSLALCSLCHMWFDNHKVLSFEWFRKKWPERWQNIQNILQSRTKAGDLFIRTRYEELKSDPPSVSLPLSPDLNSEPF